MRIFAKITLLAVASCSIILYGQQKKPNPAPGTEKADQFEDAHRGMFAPTPDKAKEAGKLTAQVAAKLPAAGTAFEKLPRKNFIDDIIFSKIERDRIPHASLTSDEEFIRRVYLDATGELPTGDAVRAFIADKNEQKRDRIIDFLVGTDAFAEQWAWYWGDLFRITGRTGGDKDSFAFWIKEFLKVDRPYNEVVYDIITPSAKSHGSIPQLGLIGRNNVGVNILPTSSEDFHVSNRLDSIDEMSIDVARIFLGINTTCISCHDGAGHLEQVNLYLSQRKRTDFYGMAAFFGKTRMVSWWDDRSKNTGNAEQVIDDLGKGYDTGNDAPFMTESLNRYPRDGKLHEPVFLLTGEKPRPGVNPRKELARLLTSNMQFNRATANLIWGRLMTVAFVSPFDGFDLARLDPHKTLPNGWTVQPTNPELLEALAKDFQENNYSIQHLIRTIMKSTAYQLSARFDAEWKDEYTNYYARHYVRLLRGPEIIDAIASATGKKNQFQYGSISVSSIKELSGPADVGGKKGGEVSAIMQAFFQGNREEQVPEGNQPSTLQALMMTSTQQVNQSVMATKGSRLEKLASSDKSDKDVIEELFLNTLARKPTPAEEEVALHAFEKDRKRGLENVQWALLNGIEFILNH